jgi:hypothetical protein
MNREPVVRKITYSAQFASVPRAHFLEAGQQVRTPAALNRSALPIILQYTHKMVITQYT